MAKICIYQIQVTTDHIYGVDGDGQVWYRDKMPVKYTTSSHTTTSSSNKKDEEKKLWKRLSMEARERIEDDENLDFLKEQNVEVKDVPPIVKDDKAISTKEAPPTTMPGNPEPELYGETD